MAGNWTPCSTPSCNMSGAECPACENAHSSVAANSAVQVSMASTHQEGILHKAAKGQKETRESCSGKQTHGSRSLAGQASGMCIHPHTQPSFPQQMASSSPPLLGLPAAALHRAARLMLPPRQQRLLHHSAGWLRPACPPPPAHPPAPPRPHPLVPLLPGRRHAPARGCRCRPPPHCQPHRYHRSRRCPLSFRCCLLCRCLPFHCQPPCCCCC